MLNASERDVAFEIAEQLVVRTEIQGKDLHKHIKSVIGKYCLEYKEEHKYNEFEEFVLKTVEKKKQNREKMKEQKNKVNIWIKDIESNEIKGFKTRAEAATYIDLTYTEIFKYINKKIFKERYVVVDDLTRIEAIVDYEKTQINIQQKIKGKRTKDKIKITNTFTKEEFMFDKQAQVIVFLGAPRSTVNSAIKLGRKIKGTWKVEKIEV